jgi:hypothetical protein
MDNVNAGREDPHSGKWVSKLNGRFPLIASKNIDVFVRDYKEHLKELLKNLKARLAE